MKKLLSVLLTAMMALTLLPSSVLAEQLYDQDYYMSDVNILVSDDNDVIGLTYFSKADDTNYMVTIDGNRSVVIDLKTNTVVTSGTYGDYEVLKTTNIKPLHTESGLGTLALDPYDYDVWFNAWGYAGACSSHFDLTTLDTISSIAGFLAGQLLKHSPWARWANAADVITSFAISAAGRIWNMVIDETYTVYEMRNNVYCTYLCKLRLTTYAGSDTSGTVLGQTDGEDHMWLLDWYDPMAPYECEILHQIY